MKTLFIHNIFIKRFFIISMDSKDSHQPQIDSYIQEKLIDKQKTHNRYCLKYSCLPKEAEKYIEKTGFKFEIIEHITHDGEDGYIVQFKSKYNLDKIQSRIKTDEIKVIPLTSIRGSARGRAKNSHLSTTKDTDGILKSALPRNSSQESFDTINMNASFTPLKENSYSPSFATQKKLKTDHPVAQNKSIFDTENAKGASVAKLLKNIRDKLRLVNQNKPPFHISWDDITDALHENNEVHLVGYVCSHRSEITILAEIMYKLIIEPPVKNKKVVPKEQSN
jgi:hypothetical protein